MINLRAFAVKANFLQLRAVVKVTKSNLLEYSLKPTLAGFGPIVSR